MMHILKIIHGFPPDYNAGSEIYSQSICKEFAKSHKVSVFTREEKIYEPDFKIRKQVESQNLTLYFANNPRGRDGFRHFSLDFELLKLIAKNKPDIAHIGHLNHLSTGVIDVLNQCNIPIIYSLHDFWLMCPRGQFLQINYGNQALHQLCDAQDDEKCALNCYSRYFSGKYSDYEHDLDYWKSWIHTRMVETRSIIAKTDLFIAPSQYLRNRFISDFHVPEEKIIYLDYGISLHSIKTNPVKKIKPFTFGYIGTHIPSKGVNILIEAFTKLQSKATLQIWGRENQFTNELKSIAQKSGNQVVFKGEYPNQMVGDVLQGLDCLVVPSIWAENSPIVIHEAQKHRVPVITANCGGMAEYVHHQVNGLLFKHRNAESLANQMQWAVNHRSELLALGQKGYLYSDNGEVPDIETHCDELFWIYKSVIAKHEPQALANNT